MHWNRVLEIIGTSDAAIVGDLQTRSCAGQFLRRNLQQLCFGARPKCGAGSQKLHKLASTWRTFNYQNSGSDSCLCIFDLDATPLLVPRALSSLRQGPTAGGNPRIWPLPDYLR